MSGKAEVEQNLCNNKWYVFVEIDGDDTTYLSSSMEIHNNMRHGGGAYFDTRDEAQALADKYNAQSTTKTWGEMTDAEKGALLLAEYEGKELEWIDPCVEGDKWDKRRIAFWRDHMAYRIKPIPRDFWVHSGSAYDSEVEAILDGCHNAIHVREVME